MRGAQPQEPVGMDGVDGLRQRCEEDLFFRVSAKCDDGCQKKDEQQNRWRQFRPQARKTEK